MLNRNLYTCISKFMKLYGCCVSPVSALYLVYDSSNNIFHSIVKDGALHVVNVYLELFLGSFLVCLYHELALLWSK